MYNVKTTGGYVYDYDNTTGRTFRITDKDVPVVSTQYHSKKPYNIETFNLQKGDVILLHLSEDLDIDTVRSILSEMEKTFPNNTVLVANEYILKGLTILRLPQPRVGEVNMFDKEISAPDFLDHWLKQSPEF